MTLPKTFDAGLGVFWHTIEENENGGPGGTVLQKLRSQENRSIRGNADKLVKKYNGGCVCSDVVDSSSSVSYFRSSKD